MKYFNALLLALCFVCVTQLVLAQSPNFLDSGFAPVIDQAAISVNVITKQPDGKILVGGNFAQANNDDRLGIARFNTDGSLDTSFKSVIAPRFLGAGVRSIVVQSDGKILVGGRFVLLSTFENKNFIRLNSDGSEDTSFNFIANSFVYAITPLPDGKYMVGGNFTSINGANRVGIARINPDGSVDQTFGLIIRAVYSIAALPGGGFIFGGSFISTSPTVITRIVKTDSIGNVDTSFSSNASANSTVKAVKVQTDGRIIVGGDFSIINGVNRKGVARLNSDGTLDNSFAPELNGSSSRVESIDLTTSGRILIGGLFTSVNSASRFYVAKLNLDGSLDTAFVPSNDINAPVYAVFAESDGNTLIGGEFQGFNGTVKYRLARLSQTGATVSSFNARVNISGDIHDIEIQSDGKIIAAGIFSYANGKSYSGIVRFLADGTIDPGFATSDQSQFASDVIEDVEILPDGKIMIVGTIIFPSAPTTLYCVIRLNADGTVDNTFAPVRVNDYFVTIVKALPNGQVLVGGDFEHLNNINVQKLARINSDGAIDTSFNLMFESEIFPSIIDIKVRNDGKILVGGYFNKINGAARKNLALINQNGTVDSNFVADASSTVLSIIELSDSSLLVSGAFASINNMPQNRIARLTANGQVDPSFSADSSLSFSATKIKSLSDGRIIAFGYNYSLPSYAYNLVVLNSNGSINALLPNDRGFNSFITDVEVQNDGKIVVGGAFTKVGNSVRYGLARLNSLNFSSKTLFDYDGDGKADISVFRPENGSWYIQQSTAGFTGLAFGLSTDKLVPADYDGDGKTDVAVVRNGVWYLLRSQAGFTGINFGVADDVPVPADYDGDGKTDIAVFRPSNGYWYILQSSNNQFIATLFGISTDKPVPADYDGDGKADIAVNRNGNWYIQRSQLGFIGTLFGDANDKLVPADYDGDGKTDIAVFRPSNGTWYLQQSTAGFAGIAFGLGTDIPVAADYDGDGKADLAVVRNGNWYLNRTTQGFTGIQFGTSTDLPIPNAFVK